MKPRSASLDDLLPLLTAGRFLTPDEVGALLGVSRRRVYVLRDSGLLVGTAIGRSLRFAPTDVLALLEAGRDEEWPPR